MPGSLLSSCRARAICSSAALSRHASESTVEAACLRAQRGVYLAPSAFEAGFTSLAHTDEDIDATLEALRDSFAAIA